MIDASTFELAKSAMAYAAPFLLAGLAGLGTLYKFERDKRVQIENKLNDNKAKVYAEFVDEYSRLFFKEDGKEKTPEEFLQIISNVQKFARNSMMYASDEVVEKFSRMYRLLLTPIQESEGIEASYKRVDAFSDVVVAIRKELGHTKTKLSYDTIGSLLITDYHRRKTP